MGEMKVIIILAKDYDTCTSFYYFNYYNNNYNWFNIVLILFQLL